MREAAARHEAAASDAARAVRGGARRRSARCRVRFISFSRVKRRDKRQAAAARLICRLPKHATPLSFHMRTPSFAAVPAADEWRACKEAGKDAVAHFALRRSPEVSRVRVRRDSTARDARGCGMFYYAAAVGAQPEDLSSLSESRQCVTARRRFCSARRRVRREVAREGQRLEACAFCRAAYGAAQSAQCKAICAMSDVAALMPLRACATRVYFTVRHRDGIAPERACLRHAAIYAHAQMMRSC